MKLARDLREFVESLNSHGVEYLVVGGHAVAFHGHPRFTGDIDFLIAATAPNAARVLACHAPIDRGRRSDVLGKMVSSMRIVPALIVAVVAIVR